MVILSNVWLYHIWYLVKRSDLNQRLFYRFVWILPTTIFFVLIVLRSNAITLVWNLQKWLHIHTIAYTEAHGCWSQAVFSLCKHLRWQYCMYRGLWRCIYVYLYLCIIFVFHSRWCSLCETKTLSNKTFFLCIYSFWMPVL